MESMAVLKATTGNTTHVGQVRPDNQDYFGAYDVTPYGAVWVVCDGMGGNAGGAVASVMAVEAVRDTFAQAGLDSPQAALRSAVQSANRTIYRRSRREADLAGMGTTAVLLAVQDDVAHLAHVGDSRAYLVRDGEIARLTRDHTVVQRLIEQGRITETEAQSHPQAHVVTRSLGVEQTVDPTLSAHGFDLRAGDVVVLCTDGLTAALDDQSIRDAVLSLPPQQACERLVDLANAAGGPDNVTVQVIAFSGDSATAPGDGPVELRLGGLFRSWRAWLVALLVLAGLLLSVLLFELRGGKDGSGRPPAVEERGSAHG